MKISNKERQKIYARQSEIIREELKRIKNFKFRTCPACKSKIKTEFLNNIDCLVCKKPMLSKTAKLELEKGLKSLYRDNPL